ncbi:DUF3450 domain-containing protein [Desulfonema ishimotonii]|uniref:DUF3450 domain-containing protein n=1 Tax=Desulfonema ishimotonii TaxID=45657 RepID=A0A401FZG0_9BACT|nr:DUF3450 domain-containing protein [Desulfonema ishimotonii]GBC62337.1 DUF3450 domain-containing protein [Desulfonema ishimotonii]
MKIQIILCCCVALACGPGRAHAGTPPAALQKQVEQNIGMARKSQEKADAWGEKRADMLSRIREQKNTQRWLSHQIRKYTVYMEKQEAVMAELARRKAESEKIRMNLEPFLDELSARLAAFIQEDLPFLPEERAERLRALNAVLDNYHMSLADKARRVFEALQVEASYGTNVEQTEGVIRVNGNTIQVSLFRLGRVALFYQTPDGHQSGWFNRESGQWEPLPGRYGQEIARAMEIAEKKRTPVLLNLPVGSAQ